MKREPDELVIDALRRAPGPVPSAELTAAVRARAVAALRRRGLPTWINVAAALVLVVGAASWLRVAERVPDAMAPMATMPPPASPLSTAPPSAPAVAPEALSSEVLPAQMERARVPQKTGEEEPGEAITFGTPATTPADSSLADNPASATSRVQSPVSVSPESLESDLQRADAAVAKRVEQPSDKLGVARPEGPGAALDDETLATAAQESLPGPAPVVADAPQEPFVPDPALSLPVAKPAAPPAPAAPPSTKSAPAELSPAPLSAPAPPEPVHEQPRDEARTMDAQFDPRFAQLRTALATGDAERVKALLDALKREVPREQWPSDLAERHWPR